MYITKDTTITELLEMDERAASLLMESGMNCIGCAYSDGETLEQAAAEHGIDPVLLLRKLNLHLNGTL